MKEIIQNLIFLMKSRIVTTEKKELSVDDVEIPDTIPLAAGNNDISVTYLGKEYTSTITAKQKTAAVVAAETYKTELDNSVSNVTTDMYFCFRSAKIHGERRIFLNPHHRQRSI